MNPTLILLTTLLLAPTALLAQAKPEVANATKSAKRAWESAPAEKKAFWQQQRDPLIHINLSDDTHRQVVIARGSPEPDEYHAHPTTAMLADNKTMFCVWNLGHGGHAGPMARSDDAGLTWTRMDDALPPNYVNFKNCPSLYRLTDPQGKERLWIFAARTLTDKENPRPIQGRNEGFMPRIVSEDNGKTWRELPPIGGRISKDDPFRNIMTFSSIVRLKDGSSMGFFHRGSGIGEEGTLQVLQSVTRDGGLTWSEPVIACDGTKLDGKHPCEPYVFRSPDGGELCCLMRENRRSGTSLVMFSRDEGKTWSEAVDAPWGLTGDRHHGVRLPDGRLVIVFRNASPNAKDKGGFIAWVGTYDDIRQGKPGQYRVSLLKTFKDGFYPGIHLLPDGTIVATTYANYRKEDSGCSIVSIRFKISEVDGMSQAAKPLTNSIGMTLVQIEAGTFIMGQDGPAVSGNGNMATHHAEFGAADWDEKPAHRVGITRPFYMGSTEVTLGQFRRFEPGFRAGKGAEDEAVEGVSWTKAVTFCEWLSKKEGRTYRLPTEAEWEYACRAGTDTLYHTGGMLPEGHQKWFGRSGWRELYFPDGPLPAEYSMREGAVSLRVAETAPNAWGLHDMHGNVAEWCADWYGPYDAGDQSDPLGRSNGDFRVFRGGAHSQLTRMVRSANRGGWIPDAAVPGVGFRIVQGEWPAGAHLPEPAPPLNGRNVSQHLAEVALAEGVAPYMEGPRFYRQIPPGQVGPLFTRHNHSPGLVECPNGDLLATWFSCISEPGPELCNAASRLRFGAKDWEEPSPFWDGPDINDHAPKLWWDGKGTLFHMVFAHGMPNVLRTSGDNGATWSKARLFPMSGEFGNALIRSSSGVLAISLDGASLVVSEDGGATWRPTGKTRGRRELRPGEGGPCLAGIHAPLVELKDGRIMAMGRFDDVADQQRFAFKMPVSYTADLGETWTYEASEFPVVSSTQRPVLLRLREGPILLCSFTDQARDLKKGLGGKGLNFPGTDGAFNGVGLFAAVSYDEGKTWPERRLVVGPGEGFTNANGVPPNTNGYLAATQTRDGRIQLITSSKHYTFNLAWVKALPAPPKK